MSNAVPNYIPLTPSKICFVGEAPGANELQMGRPFVGYSGKLLANLASAAGIPFSNCMLGNVTQHRPPNNEIKRFRWDGDEIQDGLEQLRQDIQHIDPYLVILLGNTPLKAALDPDSVHPLEPKYYKYSVSNWRGSFFVPEARSSPFYGRKCTAAYHPANCLRQYENTPILRFDLMRAAKEAGTRNWVPPERNLSITNLTPVEIVEKLRRIRQERRLIAIDIEGGIDSMTCISIADAKDNAFIVPFTGHTGSFYANEDDEMLVFRELALLLEDPLVPKVLQNSLYDLFVLAYSYRILVRGVVDDTMLKHWEAYCELPKGLAFQCSLYTREPFYKHERTVPDLKTHWTYCCRDSATTHEINSTLSSHLVNPSSLSHYRFNMDMLSPLLYMELRGIRYDIEGAAKRRREVLNEVYNLNYQLDELTLVGLDFTLPKAEIEKTIREIACKKRGGEYKKAFLEDAPRIEDILSRYPNLTPTDKGELNFILDLGMNVKSPRYKDYLYETLGLPKQYNNVTGALSTNYESLLNIYKVCDHPAVRLGIDIGSRRTRTQMLSISADGDGRIRCAYNVVGTETGRLTCYTSPTGSGYNLQTIPEYDRDLFLADDGYWLFQCDLSGADTWTVAAYLSFLGERTMMDDLLAGLKPAKILALMRRHGATVSNLSREELREMSEQVKKSDWDYFASKIGVHGSNYLMGPRTLARNLFIQSEGKISLTETEIRNLQGLYMLRYRVKKLHDYINGVLSARPEIRVSSGHSRHFFGRRDEILGEALAHEPQANTTYATNLAALRLWKDPENRRTDGSLIIEPLHQVHDALVGQFPKDRTAWAIGKIREYFNNTIRIANMDIVIPFEGGYGTAWGSLKEGKI